MRICLSLPLSVVAFMAKGTDKADILIKKGNVSGDRYE